jgi:hypothetical protein
MTSQNQTLDSYVQSLAIMWTGLFTGPLLFGMISYFLRVSGQFSYLTTAEFSNIMIYLVPAAMIGALLGGNFLYKNRLSAIKKMATQDEKLTAYRSVFIIRNAMPEMAAFLAVVAYLLTGDLRFLAGAAVMLIWLIAIFPTRGRLVTELEF